MAAGSKAPHSASSPVSRTKTSSKRRCAHDRLRRHHAVRGLLGAHDRDRRPRRAHLQARGLGVRAHLGEPLWLCVHLGGLAPGVLSHEVGRLAAADDLAVRHQRHLVGEPLGLLDVMRGHQDRGPLGPQRVDQGPELGADLRIEADRGLVEQQERRVVGESARQQEAPAHPARQLVDRVVPASVEPGERQSAVHRGAHVLDPVEPREHGQVVLHGHVHVEVVELRHHAHLGACLLRLTRQLVAEDGDLALVRDGLAGEHSHGRGLAGAVGSEQAEADARGHLEVQPIHGGDRPKALHHPMHFDRGHGPPHYVVDKRRMLFADL